MPAIKKINVKENLKHYPEIASRMVAEGDKNCCSPMAVAMLTGAPHDHVLKRLEEMGRKKGRGTPRLYANKLIAELGFQRKPVDIKAIISKFPRPHCDVLKNLTTHHPRRFPGCLDPNKKYLAHCRGHVLAIIDGQVEDWSVNRSLRIWKLEEIVPVEDKIDAVASRLASELMKMING